MKTMKKICYLIIMCMFLYTSNANASYAYQWNIDGENLSKGQTNKNGTASWIEDDKYTGGILVLNNYNGGEIKLERIGTGLNHVFAIKLIGDNKIIAKGEEGIITNASELIFIGDGQLTINAKKPITGGKVDNNLFLNTNIVIGSLNETSNDKTIDKDISGNDKIIDKNISKFDIAIISYSCVCTITLIILITKRKKEYN